MKILLLIMIISVSGCASLLGEERILGSETNFYTAPIEVLPGREAKAILEFQNIHNDTIANVIMEIFGSLIKNGDNCEISIGDLEENDIRLYECELKAPETIISEEEYEINAKVTYQKELKIPFTLSTINDEQYELEILKGDFSRERKNFLGSDNNIAYTLTYLDEYPIRHNQGEKILFHLDLTNVGTGIVNTENPQINPIYLKEVEAPLDGSVLCDPIRPIGQNFPRVKCDINTNELEYLNEDTIILTIEYVYEIRDKTTIKVIN